jgi:hypothetical protein
MVAEFGASRVMIPNHFSPPSWLQFEDSYQGMPSDMPCTIDPENFFSGQRLKPLSGNYWLRHG